MSGEMPDATSRLCSMPYAAKFWQMRQSFHCTATTKSSYKEGCSSTNWASSGGEARK